MEIWAQLHSDRTAGAATPHYVTQWSSRGRTAARYEVSGGCLRLLIEASLRWLLFPRRLSPGEKEFAAHYAW